jgi:hypothetical protein
MLCCSNYLEVPADDEEVKIRHRPFFSSAFCFEIGVDSVETSMALLTDTNQSGISLKRYVLPVSILTQPTTAIRGCRRLLCMFVEKKKNVLREICVGRDNNLRSSQQGSFVCGRSEEGK